MDRETIDRIFRNEKDMEEIFLHCPDLIAIVDGDYFKRLNPAWTKALGWDIDYLTSTPWIEFVHPDDKGKSMEANADIHSTGNEIFDFCNRYRCQDGTYKTLEWRAKIDLQTGISYAVARVKD